MLDRINQLVEHLQQIRMDKKHQEVEEMKQKIAEYEKLQKSWEKQKETLTKRIQLMQEQIIKHKNINSNLLKKTNHKRTCSDEQTFIFNQTNISSYYPIVVANRNSNWIPRANLRSHLDSVRVVFWQREFLLSAGEDCLIKIWDKDRLKITVREHLAPIFAICGDQERIFSAGAEGVVRQWQISAFLQNGRPVSQLQCHQDSIWQMIWNPINQSLLTSSSDSSIKILTNKNNRIKQQSQLLTQPDTPTSICLLSNEKMVSGFVQSNKLIFYDIEKLRKEKEVGYPCKQLGSQTNKILNWQHNKMVIGAHEDRVIRFTDYSTCKNITNIVAHSDAVTNLCFKPNSEYELISCSHDGSLRIWDTRKFKCINDIGIHMKKYDESLLCVAHSPREQVLAVGGADGQIKLLTPQN